MLYNLLTILSLATHKIILKVWFEDKFLNGYLSGCSQYCLIKLNITLIVLNDRYSLNISNTSIHNGLWLLKLSAHYLDIL